MTIPPANLPEFTGRIRHLDHDNPAHGPLRVTLDDIDAQHALGWPDFHPEAYCHRCGNHNVSWWTEPETWNPVMRPAGVDQRWKWNEIICIPCFTELADLSAGRELTWRIVSDEYGTVELILMSC